MNEKTTKPVAWLVIADEKDWEGAKWHKNVPLIYLRKREAREDAIESKHYARKGYCQNIRGPIPLVIDPKWQENNK